MTIEAPSLQSPVPSQRLAPGCFSRTISLSLNFSFLYLFLAVLGLCRLVSAGFLQSSRGKQGLLSSCGVKASPRGFSCCRALALGHAAFSCGDSGALEHRLSNCGTRAQLLLSMWYLPGSGIEILSPVLAGRFPTTGPPKKFISSTISYFCNFHLTTLIHSV